MSPEIQEALPKYVQIANHLRDRILTGELEPGAEVPSERDIVEQWRVSRPTATRALAALRVEGLVESRQGSGTFVRERPKLYRRARDRYAHARATGRAYGSDEWSEIIRAERAPAPEEIASALGLEPGSEAVMRTRVVRDSHGPVEVSTSWFRPELAERAPRLLERSRIREGTLPYVETSTGRQGRIARDRVTARLASPEEVAQLKILEKPAAVLVVQHTTFDAQGEPIEFVEAVYPSGRFTFEDDYAIPR